MKYFLIATFSLLSAAHMSFAFDPLTEAFKTREAIKACVQKIATKAIDEWKNIPNHLKCLVNDTQGFIQGHPLWAAIVANILLYKSRRVRPMFQLLKLGKFPLTPFSAAGSIAATNFALQQAIPQEPIYIHTK